MTARFGEDAHGRSQRELDMRGLQLAMRKVRREFQIPDRILRFFCHQLSSLRLQRQSNHVLATRRHELFDLCRVLLGRRDDQKQFLQNCPVRIERFGKLASAEESARVGNLARFDVVEGECDGGQDLSHLCRLGIASDVVGERWE